MLAGQPPHPPAQGESPDTGVADQADGSGQPVLLCRRDHVGEQGAPADTDPASVRVDHDRVHPAQVDHESVIHDGLARHPVRPPAHGDLEPVLHTETHRGGDVGGVGTEGNDRRTAVDRRVPDRPCLVVVGIPGYEDRTAHSFPQGVDRAANCLRHNASPGP